MADTLATNQKKRLNLFRKHSFQSFPILKNHFIMSLIKYNNEYMSVGNDTSDGDVLRRVGELRRQTVDLFETEDYNKALENTVESLRVLRDFSDYADVEFREVLIILLFDLAEIYYSLKDYKQSKKELERIFKIIEPLLKQDAERFGEYHLLAMDLSARTLRSRKRMLDLLAKQQLHTGLLYDKVNAGVAAATDKLVDSLCKDAELLASTGDYRGAVKFYMEAIKLSKKRAGRVTRREVAMTIEMARLMMRSRQQRQRAARLLNAVLPHAVALELVELEQDAMTLLRQIEQKEEENSWRSFMAKVQSAARIKKNKSNTEE